MINQSSRESDFHEQYRLNIDVAIAAEAKAVSDIKRIAKKNADAFRTIWHWCDGRGGSILDMIAVEIGKRKPSDPIQAYTSSKTKKVIPAFLRTRVFERNAYRCVHCESHLDLTVDHITPESKGGTLDFENLQTLCRSCNSSKGAKL